MQTIQIEITSACVLKCSNCTRFSGSHAKPFFISEEAFRKAIDSLVEYSKLPHAVVGFMGGEPLLHSKFSEFCEYALSKIPREKLGLWSTFPDSPNYRKYREVIARTFGNILLNDHSRDDIKHAPVLMAAEEYFKMQCLDCEGDGKQREDGEVVEVHQHRHGRIGCAPCARCNGTGSVTNDLELFQAVEHCWVQESWSASINSKGAWFCEVAAALSDLFDGPEGWKVEPGWWKRVPKDFAAQMDWACRKCGAALPIKRVRNSQDVRDDVSPGNLERLKAVKSKKLTRGEVAVRENFEFDRGLLENHGYPDQRYKDEIYRKGIAARYGIVLTLNQRGYWEPHLSEDMPAPPPPKPEVPSLFSILNQ
jgi:organic radical activating enzyme